MTVADEILGLELALARRDEVSLPGGYAGVLDDAFAEVGQSGKVWTRHETLMALAASIVDPSVDLLDFTLDELAPTVWLSRYDTVIAGVRSHRSSLWIRSGDRFRIRYQQGTPAPEGQEPQ